MRVIARRATMLAGQQESSSAHSRKSGSSLSLFLPRSIDRASLVRGEGKHDPKISKILISSYYNILDIAAEYLDITTKHIRWLSHS